jgi:hypothetical protein
VRDQVRVILAADGSLRAAPDVTLTDLPEPPFQPVHPVLVADTDAMRILRSRFRLGDGDGADWGRLLDVRIRAAEESNEWDAVWTLLRRIPRAQLDQELKYRSVKLRSLNGWAEPDSCFRPGTLVLESDLDLLGTAEQLQLRSRLIDEVWHHRDLAILNALNVRDQPGWEWGYVYKVARETGLPGVWLTKWQDRWVEEYWKQLHCRPDRARLGPVPFQMPYGWDLLMVLQGDALRRTTDALLDVLSADSRNLKPVTFRHSTRSNPARARNPLRCR